MQIPVWTDAGILDALTDIRAALRAYVPEGVEREAAEAGLRQVEQFALVGVAASAVSKDAPTDGVFVAENTGADLQWTFVSPNFARMHCAGSSAAIAEPPISDSVMDRFARRCRATVDVREPTEYEDRSERSDSPQEIHTRLSPLFDSEGCVRWIAGVSRDVTDQRVADRQLRKQNRRLQNILGCISDGFVVVDRDWRITFVNSRAEQILGSARANLLGAPLSGLSCDLTSAGLRQPTEIELTPDGMPRRWIGVRAYPSQDGASLYLQDVTERREAEAALRHGLDRVQATLDGVVNAIVYTVELRDPYTGGHQRRVSSLACAIARALGYNFAQIEILRIAGLLHDVGKISIPAEILNRPGRLSEPERIIVRTHAQIGYDILKEIAFDSPVALIALQHHERLDGSGYPQGLHEDSIIPEAQILAIADVVEAMASHRPYRAALGVEAALNEVMMHRGTRYNDAAVTACLAAFEESGFDFDQVIQTETLRRDANAHGAGSDR